MSACPEVLWLQLLSGAARLVRFRRASRGPAREPILVAVSMALAGAPATPAWCAWSGRGSVAATSGAEGWRFEERLTCAAGGAGLHLLAERDPGEPRWNDWFAAALTIEGRGRLVAAGDLSVRVPAQVFAPRGPDGEASLLAPPSPARIGPWRSSSEFGAVRGAGVLCEGRRASVAIVAGRTSLDARVDDDGALRLLRAGRDAGAAPAERGAAREDAVVGSLWIGTPRRGAALTVAHTRARPEFARAAGEPRDGSRAGAAFVRRSASGREWCSAAAGLGSWDMFAGMQRTGGAVAADAAIGVSGGAGPRAARRPASPGGRSGGFEAAARLNWTPAPGVRVRVRGEMRAPREGREARTVATDLLWRAAGAEFDATIEQTSSRRARFEWRQPLGRALALSIAMTRGEGGAAVSGASLGRSRGTVRWTFAVKSASGSASAGGALLGAARGGAHASARIGWESHGWRTGAQAAYRWRRSAAGSTAFAFSVERAWGPARRSAV